MKILFCNYEYPPLGGGGGVAHSQLAEQLVKIGHHATVLTTKGVDLPTREKVNGVSIVRLPVLGRSAHSHASLVSMLCYVFGGLAYGSNRVSGENYDVLNTHFAVPTGPVGIRLAKTLGLPNVLTVHGGDVYDPSKSLSPHKHAPLRSLVRYVARNSYCTVAGSSDIANHLKQKYDDTLDVRVINYGINPPPPQDNTLRSELELNDDDFAMVAIGRLVPRKQMDQLIRVVANLDDPRVKLLVLGDGPELENLKQLSSSLGVREQVLFKGFVSEQDKYRCLYLADLFVYTSHHEGFGLVFLEAMGCGLPVVSYDNGGQCDFLRDKGNGRLIPLNDLDKFTDACKSLWFDKKVRDILGKAAQQDASRYFIEAYAQRYEDIFQEATAQYRT